MNREHIAELFKKYGDDVFRLAFSYLGNRQDAEDVCQSVFLKLTDGRHRPEPDREKAWLLTCTANECRSLFRSFWRRNVGELSDALPAPDMGTGEREVLDAVMALGPKYRAVVHLYCFEGYSQGEIADILGISRTAVQTRLSRAREMLKKEVFQNE